MMAVYFGWRWFKSNVTRVSVLHEVYLQLNDGLSALTAEISAFLFNLFGYSATINGRILVIDEFTKIHITDHCVGLGLYVMFLAFVSLFPGKQMPKVWYLPFGIAFILAGNIARICGMGLTQLYIPGSFGLMHLVVLRGMLFLVLISLCLGWMKISFRTTPHRQPH